MALELVASISALRISIPPDLRPADARRSVLLQLQVCVVWQLVCVVWQLVCVVWQLVCVVWQRVCCVAACVCCVAACVCVHTCMFMSLSN